MGKKLRKALLAAGAAAASYSYLPSQLGKLNRKIERYAERSAEPLQGTDLVLYLTFDDGPHPVYTVKLLNLLQKYNIKGSFFVVGKFAEENPDLVLRMTEEGHTVGLHSYYHKSAMIQGADEVRQDMKRCIAALADLGIRPKYYRPPWGHVNWFSLKEIKERGMKKVLWDVMAEDWEENADEETIQYKLLKRASSGDIICLHDRQADEDEKDETEAKREPSPLKMIAALEKTIPLWIEEGYRFEVL